MISVYITCKDMAEAKKIAAKLLENKLIACANMFPIESMFSWKGKLNDVNETVMFCKAKKANFRKIEAQVKRLHSYEVPCIVAFKWEKANPDYKKWVIEHN